MRDIPGESPCSLPTPDEKITIGPKSVVIEVTTYYRGKTGGYVVERNHVSEILDSKGRKLAPEWSDKWTQIAPGIETRQENRGSRTTYGSRSHETHVTGSIRIHRHACPVHVKFDCIEEYNDYDDWSSSSSTCHTTWVRYEG